MRLKVFQSDKGDCMLLSGADGTRVLVDGGMRDSYREHVAPALAALRRRGEQLDLVYLSHVDQDHIAGVLALMDDLVAWRVRDYQHESGNRGFADPASARPPDVARIWHNAFHDQVGANSGPIEEMLAATTPELEAAAPQALREAAAWQRGLQASIGEATELTARVGPEQLDIPVNDEFDGKLALVRDGQPALRLGSLDLTVIGPFEEDLLALRKEWNEWLRGSAKQLERIRARMRGDAERLDAGEIGRFQEALAQRAHVLGNRKRVTVSNLASLMLLAEEDGATVLLTGDGHAREVLRGLEHAGRLDADGGIHVRVLKVQHHGSEHNIDLAFCKRVTADHYVFCANGEHENPDLDGLDAVIDSRIGPESRRSRNDGAERPFKLWFNSSAAAAAERGDPVHMREVERKVAARAASGGDRMRYAFLDRSSFEIRL